LFVLISWFLYYYPIKPFNIFAARFVPYFVVVLAGRQARLRPPPRLAQPCLANLFKAFYRIIVLDKNSALFETKQSFCQPFAEIKRL
jgi:hypothetical protein